MAGVELPVQLPRAALKYGLQAFGSCDGMQQKRRRSESKLSKQEIDREAGAEQPADAGHASADAELRRPGARTPLSRPGRAKFAFDVWGDTVNTASRMESQGAANKIRVTDEVRNALADTYVFEGPELVDVKGKGPTRVWTLVARPRE